MEIAKETNTPVLFTKTDAPLEVAEPIKSPNHVIVVQLEAAPVMAATPAGEEVAVQEVVTPLPQEVAAAPVLPKTAGSLPLFALLGLIALGGAAGASFAARRP
jgi:hypothetical protein